MRKAEREQSVHKNTNLVEIHWEKTTAAADDAEQSKQQLK